MERASEKQIENWIDGMNRFNATPEFGTTRIVFTKPDLQNREYVKEEMKKNRIGSQGGCNRQHIWNR